MKNMKKMLDEADDSVLDDLISQCEAKMSSKFKPKEEKSLNQRKNLPLMTKRVI